MHKVEDSVYHLFEKQQQAFLAKKSALFSEYMQKIHQNTKENIFISCTGWDETKTMNLDLLLGSSTAAVQQGGYFFRYNGIGVCINPGTNFFERFSEQGFHLWQIDKIIVTSNHPSMCCDLPLIHKLTRQINLQLAEHEQEPHVIEYFLHPDVFASHQALLRPHFRQEKESLLCLETFNTAEKRCFSPNLTFSYTKEGDALLCRFDLQNGQCLGYVDKQWDDSFAPFFSGCTVLITTYCSQLMNTQIEALKCVLLTEFVLTDGDIRLEATKQLRQQCPDITILPLECGIGIDLDYLTLVTPKNPQSKATDSENFETKYNLGIPLDDVRIMRLQNFGTMKYLSCEQTL